MLIDKRIVVSGLYISFIINLSDLSDITYNYNLPEKTFSNSCGNHVVKKY